MNYLKLNKNDIANGDGICVSLFVAGCPHHCYNCFNPDSWDFNAGKPFTWDTIREIEQAISANGILRNLSILGGEPLAPQNRTCVAALIADIRKIFENNIKIYLWTGYIYEDLLKEEDSNLMNIFNDIDILIDGPYIDNQHESNLYLRGSKNQRIIQLKN